MQYNPICPRTAGGNTVLELLGFPIHKQQTDHTCGPAAVRMCLEFLGLRVTEKEIAHRSFTHPLGTLHWTLLDGYNHFLSSLGLRASLTGDAPDVYTGIISRMRDGLPTIFIYGVTDHFHPPKKVTHYGIAAGIDEPAGVIKIANPFGTLDEMPLDEWWARFSLVPEHAPLPESIGMALGLLKPRTVLFLDRV